MAGTPFTIPDCSEPLNIFKNGASTTSLGTDTSFKRKKNAKHTNTSFFTVLFGGLRAWVLLLSHPKLFCSLSHPFWEAKWKLFFKEILQDKQESFGFEAEVQRLRWRHLNSYHSASFPGKAGSQGRWSVVISQATLNSSWNLRFAVVPVHQGFSGCREMKSTTEKTLEWCKNKNSLHLQVYTGRKDVGTGSVGEVGDFMSRVT